MNQSCGAASTELGEDNEWKDVQKKDTNNRPSETRNRRKRRKNIITKVYSLSNENMKGLWTADR